MYSSQQPAYAPAPPTPASPTPPVATPPSLNRKRTSLRRRIIWAMVIVTFLSAIFGGIVYQTLSGIIVNKAAEQADTATKNAIVSRIEAGGLPLRQKTLLVEQVNQYFAEKEPFSTVGFKVLNIISYALWAVALVALLSGLLAFILGLLLTRRIVRPLEKLQKASQRVAAGDFNQRVDVGGNDEVAEVAYSFNFMAAQLQGAEENRRKLLSDVAHELKTPLASIQGHVEALRDKLPRAKANPDAIYEIVLEDVAELDRMVSSLRTWLNNQSLLEQLEPKSLQLPAELGKLVERFRPRAESAGVRLGLQVFPNTPPGLADSKALSHLLGNLVDNALRYTPAGGQVRLLAWAGEGEQPGMGNPKMVTVAVADTGCGIAPEHWPHLFERFYRVDKSRTRDTGGTGLGLAIVRELVEAQGGRIWLNSQVGRGTTFFVTLPSA